MKHEQDILERESGIPAHPERAASAVGVVTGAIMGGATGFFAAAGTVGMAIGALVGAAAGFGVSKLSQERAKRDFVKDEQLDREIGVIDGDIGSMPPAAPREQVTTREGIGTYSSSSAGAAGIGLETAPASGPIPR